MRTRVRLWLVGFLAPWLALGVPSGAAGITAPRRAAGPARGESPAAASRQADQPIEARERSPFDADEAASTFDAAWRIIHETHFDRSFNGVDWEAVRDELRPRALRATRRSELRAVINEMLGRLGQSHFNLMAGDTAATLELRATSTPEPPADATDPEALGVVGLEVRRIDGLAVVTRVDANGPADRAGVEPGWVVHAIGPDRMRTLHDRLPTELDARRADLQTVVLVAERLAGPPGSPVEVEFLDGRNRSVPLTIRREPTRSLPVKLGHYPTFYAHIESRKLVGGDGTKPIGIIRFNTWMPPIALLFDAAMDQLRDAGGIILDLRGNLGGVANMVTGISGHFLDDPDVLGTMETRDSSLRFAANPRRVDAAGSPVEPFGRPLAVLTDSLTSSASEVFAGGLQGLGRARVFGERTMGAVLGSVIERLPNGDVLQHALGDFVTASGVRLEGRGVIPDQTVPLSRDQLLQGRDAALEAAVRWMLGLEAAGATSVDALSEQPAGEVSETLAGGPREIPTDLGRLLGVATVSGAPVGTIGPMPATPETEASEALPTPRELIERYVDAIGGRDLLLAYRSRHVTGGLEIPTQGLAGSLEILTARPNKMLVRSTLSNVGEVASGFDGEVGWLLNPMTGPMILAGDQLEQARVDAVFDAALHDDGQYASMDTVTLLEFAGRPSHQLRLIRRSGREELEYYDTETGLLIGRQTTRETPMGTVRSTSVFESYAAFGGLLIPTRTVQRLLGTEQIVTFDTVEFDTVDDSAFVLPAEIEALVVVSAAEPSGRPAGSR